MEKNQYSRRNFIKQSVLVGAAAPFIGKNLFADKRENTKKSVLFVWGGWDGHEPKQCVDVFAPWLEKQGFDVEISNTLDSYLNEENLNSKDRQASRRSGRPYGAPVATKRISRVFREHRTSTSRALRASSARS